MKDYKQIIESLCKKCMFFTLIHVMSILATAISIILLMMDKSVAPYALFVSIIAFVISNVLCDYYDNQRKRISYEWVLEPIENEVEEEK